MPPRRARPGARGMAPRDPSPPPLRRGRGRGRGRDPSPPPQRRGGGRGRRRPDRSPVRERSPQGRLPARERSPLQERSPARERSPLQERSPVRERSPLNRRRDSTPPPHLIPERPASPRQDNEGLLAFLLDEVQSLKKMVNIRGTLIDPLELTVTPELKTKICAGKFIDFSLLLSKNYQSLDDDSQKKLQGFQDEEGNLTFKSVKPKKSTLSIDQWSSAFNTYMSVYLTQHIGDLQGMLSYAELIRGAARDHPNSVAWRSYDEHFRSKKASDPIRPWGMIDNELWLAMFCKPSQSSKDGKQSSSEKVRNYCLYFNKMGGCNKDKCKYKHACSGCGRSGHSLPKCYSNKNKTGNQKSQRSQDQDHKEGKGSTIKVQEGFRPFPAGNKK